MKDLDYFSASEALHRIKQVKEDKLKKELDYIYEHIENAILNEKEFVEVDFGDKPVSKDAIDFLLKKGFKITNYNKDQVNNIFSHILCIKFK